MHEIAKDFLLGFVAKVKRAHRSGTILFNAVLATVNEALPYLLPFFAEQLPTLQEYMPSEVFTNVMRFVLVANMLYRFKTTKSLAER